MRIYSPCCHAPLCPDCRESFVCDIDGNEYFVERLNVAPLPLPRWGSPVPVRSEVCR